MLMNDIWLEIFAILFDCFYLINCKEVYVADRRITCLKYLVLANMLTKSSINPFDSQEARPHKNNSEILAMTNLVRSVGHYVFLSLCSFADD